MFKGKTYNVLFCIDSFYDGGAEIFAIRLANELSKYHNIFFLELDPFNSKEKNQLQLLDTGKIKLLQAGKNALGKWLYHGGSWIFLKKYMWNFYEKYKKSKIKYWLKYFDIDIVHSHCWETDFYFSSLKALNNFKIISSFHGHYESLKNTVPGFEDKTRHILNKIDRVVYLSSTHLNTLDEYQYDIRKRKRIFYGLKYPEQKSHTTFDGGIMYLCMVSRGIPEKGWRETIEAVCTLEMKYSEKLQLHLVGNGDLLTLLKEKNNNKNIFFHGYQDDVRSFISLAHICLLPSYYPGESLPNAVIEYLLCGKPVIATKIGAIPEMITYENTIAGILIDLENNIVKSSAIKIAIEKYFKDYSLVEKHSKTAMLASKKFSMDKCVFSYNELYNEVLN
jgi:L-malate glycosyltransferase